MPLEPVAKVAMQIPALFEKGAKCRSSTNDINGAHTSQADIEIAPFPEQPAIPFHIPAEEQSRRVRLNATQALLFRTHDRFNHLGGNRLFPSDVCSQQAGHRAEMATRSHQQACSDTPIHDPAAVFSFQCCHRFAQQLAYTTALQQIVIKLITADTVTDDRSIAGYGRTPVDQAGAETADLLENSPLTVFSGSQPQGLKHRRGDPAGTRFLTRKARLVHQKNITPRLSQLSGTGRSGRSTADHQYVAGLHQDSPPGARRWARVKGI